VAKKDTSKRVQQREKVKEGLALRDLQWTDKQREFIQIATDKNTRVMLVSGPAGSSKTLLSVYCSLALLSAKRVAEIIYVRSPVESSDSKIGFLPGDASEKLRYYNLPFADKLDELLPASQTKMLWDQERIRIHPLSFVRGMSWRCTAVILDEAQNCTLKEIVTTLTRIGEFSKCFVLADPDQSDLHPDKAGGFSKVQGIFSDEESAANGIRSFHFDEDDIKRSAIVKFIVHKMKAMNLGNAV
jgi:phosphate starvation-inducible PhoH-like protein